MALGIEQPRVKRAWYVACRSHQLKTGKVLARRVLGQHLALYRGPDGSPTCVLDRCPHRSVPLSAGRVKDGQLMCGYHGWQFDHRGHCVRVPTLVAEPDTPARRCTTFACIEQQGFVWVWAEAGDEPDTRPFWFEHADKAGYTTVRHQVRAKASVHMVAENALDVPHTAFLHAGLFRNDEGRIDIKAVVQRFHDHVECEYIGEPRPPGVAARLLSPSGGMVKHYDRFFLPSIVQVEYRIGDENHIVLNGACTPVDDYDTVMYAVVCFRSRIPGFIIRPFVQPIALRIFGQDAVILEKQTELIHHYNAQQYVSTDVDLLGPHILRLMRKAEKGDLDTPGEPYRKEVDMRI